MSVETAGAEGPWGETSADPVTVRAHVDAERKLVRSATGEQVVAEQTLLVMPDPVVDVVTAITPESWVSVGTDRRRVIGAKPVRNRGRLIYLEVTTT
ncbi:hypothetical protein PZ938_03115 [Luteipulveratus sp. YIM 133132]|uniref:hypothetical protein n=1 Tax=Luteipulveratus flavus TaxID=3031728 RepID=UPI0023AF8795|nr:hypothetical protein [Luteipulveratus sp. YIM 133132]MDE9364583.1 hypothetical protein [Luteipulveratus sp. YIM 133132]